MKRIPPGIPPRIIDPSRRLILPQEVLDAMGVKPGDHLGFKIDGKKVHLVKATWNLEE